MVPPQHEESRGVADLQRPQVQHTLQYEGTVTSIHALLHQTRVLFQKISQRGGKTEHRELWGGGGGGGGAWQIVILGDLGLKSPRGGTFSRGGGGGGGGGITPTCTVAAKSQMLFLIFRKASSEIQMYMHGHWLSCRASPSLVPRPRGLGTRLSLTSIEKYPLST